MSDSDTAATQRTVRIRATPAMTSALVALALTVLLYGGTLTLPLFADDLVQIPWLESISWRALWSSPSPYGYYRPLWYTLWRLWGGLVGGLHPLGLHSLNVAAHCAAAWLTGLLATAWMEGETSKPYSTVSACLATALFAIFPFAGQAVAWPGAVYNPLVSAMAAGALLAYDRGRRGHGIRWIGLALLLALLAPLTYEAGLLVGPLVVLTEMLGWLQRRWPQRSSSWPLAFIALFTVTFLIWRAMRGSGVTSFGLNPYDLRRNAGYLIQGLVYPTAPLAQQIAVWRGLDPEPSLWLVALPTLALLAWSGLRRAEGALWLGVIWYALFALPPAVSMEADWVVLAPRFLYMTAAGVSLIWAAALSRWLACPRSPWHRVAAGTLLVVLLTPAAIFVRDGVRLYAVAGESLWNAAEAAVRGQPLLLVNLPLRITPHGRTYPLGFEGITPLPTRVTAEGLVYVHTGIHDAAEAVAFGFVATDKLPHYEYQLFGRSVGWEELAAAARQNHAVYLTRYAPNRIHLVEAGALGQAVPAGEPLARFGEHVALLDASGTCDEVGQVHLTATWQVETAVQTDATVFAHLLASDGTVVAQADGFPLLGMLPFWLSVPGEVIHDVRHFDAVSVGEYTIRLGVWDLATGERWPAADRPDGVVLLPVRCSEQLD
jgi:hypothetical protein